MKDKVQSGGAVVVLVVVVVVVRSCCVVAVAEERQSPTDTTARIQEQMRTIPLAIDHTPSPSFDLYDLPPHPPPN